MIELVSFVFVFRLVLVVVLIGFIGLGVLFMMFMSYVFLALYGLGTWYFWSLFLVLAYLHQTRTNLRMNFRSSYHLRLNYKVNRWMIVLVNVLEFATDTNLVANGPERG